MTAFSLDKIYERMLSVCMMIKYIYISNETNYFITSFDLEFCGKTWRASNRIRVNLFGYFISTNYNSFYFDFYFVCFTSPSRSGVLSYNDKNM